MARERIAGDYEIAEEPYAGGNRWTIYRRGRALASCATRAQAAAEARREARDEQRAYEAQRWSSDRQAYSRAGIDVSKWKAPRHLRKFV